jgi:hypothetical protein
LGWEFSPAGNGVPPIDCSVATKNTINQFICYAVMKNQLDKMSIIKNSFFGQEPKQTKKMKQKISFIQKNEISKYQNEDTFVKRD